MKFANVIDEQERAALIFAESLLQLCASYFPTD